FGLVEEFSSNQHPAYLRGAGADFVELRVAPQAPGRIVVDVAIAAQRLDRLTGHPRGFFRRVQNRAGGILARGTPGKSATVERMADGVDVCAARVHRRVHVGELALPQLQLADL